MIYQVELFSDIQEEIKPILKLHYDEVEQDKEAVPMDVDYDQFRNLETANLLNVCTARIDNVLVGYIITMISKHLHHKGTLFGLVDMYYIIKEHRKGFAGINLLKFHEVQMRKLGVIKVMTMVKIEHDHSKILERLGYKEIEKLYSKVLEV